MICFEMSTVMKWVFCFSVLDQHFMTGFIPSKRVDNFDKDDKCY